MRKLAASIIDDHSHRASCQAARRFKNIRRFRPNLEAASSRLIVPA